MTETPDPVDNTPTLPTLQINPSATRALVLMLVRVAVIVATTVGVLVKLFSTRDLAGFIVWIKSDDFVAFLFALGTLGSFGMSIWVTLSRKWREVYLGRKVPNKIAIVTGPNPAPSVEALPIAPGSIPPPADGD